MRGAMIHRVRLLVESESGGLDDQGEPVAVELVEGPWIQARVMERGEPSGKERYRPQSAAARVAGRFEVLMLDVDVDGGPVERPAASAVLETDCPVLGSPRIQLSALPETLNNGRRVIGFRCFGDVPGGTS